LLAVFLTFSRFVIKSVNGEISGYINFRGLNTDSGHIKLVFFNNNIKSDVLLAVFLTFSHFVIKVGLIT